MRIKRMNEIEKKRDARDKTETNRTSSKERTQHKHLHSTAQYAYIPYTYFYMLLN